MTCLTPYALALVLVACVKVRKAKQPEGRLPWKATRVIEGA
jgi:hypothetical protein